MLAAKPARKSSYQFGHCTWYMACQSCTQLLETEAISVTHVTWHAEAAQETNEEEASSDEGGMQGEAAGKEAYKRVQASTAVAFQRQKAARLQV